MARLLQQMARPASNLSIRNSKESPMRKQGQSSGICGTTAVTSQGLLIQCLAGAKLSVPAEVSSLVPGWTKDVGTTSSVELARRQIRKQIFGYLNLHETIFDLVRGEKIDSRMICSQLGSDINREHPMLLFVQNVLRRQLGDNELKSDYPGLAWYSKNLEYCKNGTNLWFENVIKPLLPWKSERS
jgi:hypothetical protein